MVTTRIICGSTHGAWDDYGANCSICTPTRAVGVDHRDAEIAALKARAEKAEAACAEMRAALEAVQRAYNTYGMPTTRLAAEVAVNQALRTDLGAGMVVVPRESIDEWRDVLTELAPTCRCDDAWTSRGRHEVNAKCHLVDDAKAAIADLEALLKQGGG